jgi:hypothetical protein
MKEKNKVPETIPPKVGDKIYVGSSYYIDHGEDDFDGGICTIKKVINPGFKGKGSINVIVEENPTSEHNYEYLLEHQDEWKLRYGKRVGKMNPDFG